MTLPLTLTTTQSGNNIQVAVTVPAGVNSGAGVDAAGLTVSGFSTAATMKTATPPANWGQATNPANGKVSVTDFSNDPTNAVGAATSGLLVVLNFTLNSGYTIADFVADTTVQVTSSSDPNFVALGASSVFQVPAVACFASGTCISTRRGEVAVENLIIGDEIVLATGGASPIRFIGRRTVDLAGHPAPKNVMPVRVRAHAFAEDAPLRDLFLSPDHAVFASSVLIPIHALVNGDSVAQVPTDSVTYFHIQLDTHEIILAEGLLCESYLESDDHSTFENGADALPSLAFMTPCAPIRRQGAVVEAVRKELSRRTCAV